MSATFGTPINTSALPGSTINAPTGNSLFVEVPVGYTGGVQITFQLPRSDYVLVGISVGPVANPNSKKGAGQKTVGRREFRTVTVNRGAADSQLVVTDACIPEFGGIIFDYLILVQQVSDGQIGAIDPDWETEPGE